MADVLARSFVNTPPSEGGLLDHVPAAVVVADPQGLVTAWNRGAEDLYGWSRAEMLGRRPMEVLLGPSGADEANQVLQRVRSGETWEGEFDIRTKDGRERAVRVSVSPVLEADGRVEGLVSVAFDISERHRVEALQSAQIEITRALAESDSMAEAAPQVLRTICRAFSWTLGSAWEVDRENERLRLAGLWHEPGADVGRFVRQSHNVVFTPGLGVPGRVWQSKEPAWIPDIATDDNFPRAGAAAQAGLHGAVGFPLMLLDEVVGVLEFFSPRVRPLDESLLAMVGAVGSQIAQFMERKAAESAVRESEARKAALLEAAMSIVAIDHESVITEFNQAAERMFGYRRDEALGRPMPELLMPRAYRARHRRGLARHLKTGQGRFLGKRVEMEAMRRDGTVFPMELALNRVDLPGPPAFTASIRDLTERRDAERATGQLAAIVESSSDAIIGKTLDDATILTWNVGAERMYGYSAKEAVGRQISMLVPPTIEDDVPQIMERLRRGEPIEHRETQRMHKDGTIIDVELSISPIRDRAGNLVGAATIARDITERKRLRDRLAFMSEASRMLSSSLDYRRTLRRVARLLVPRLADWCSIDLRDDETGDIQQLAVAHVDPKKVRWARSLRRRNPIDPADPRGVPAVIRSGRSELYPEITEELIEASTPDPKLRDIIRRLGMRSAMIVPLTTTGRTFGAITLVWAESGRRYDADDLALAEELASRAAQAIENSRLYEERDQAARTLQQSLLPPELPEIRGVEIAARYLPAGAGNEVGGDFYDVFETGDGAWAVAIGDVCGKGPDAAAVMGLARYTLRTAAMKEQRPSMVLETLNEAVRRQATDGRFITVCYVRLRPGTGRARVTLSCGGHPPPVLLRAKGMQQTAGRPGTLLGLFPDPELSDEALDLGPGDALVMFTDGVTDTPPSARIVGEQRLAQVLAKAAGRDAEGIARAMDERILKRRAAAARDDMALLVLRVKP